MQKIYKVDEVAQILGVQPRTVRTMCRDHRIQAFKIGYEWRIPENSLNEFIEKQIKEQNK